MQSEAPAGVAASAGAARAAYPGAARRHQAGAGRSAQQQQAGSPTAEVRRAYIAGRYQLLATVCTWPSRVTSRAGRCRADSWPLLGPAAADHRGGARGTGERAACGRDGHRPPERRGGRTGPRVQDVGGDIGATPAAGGGARRGQPAIADGHDGERAPRRLFGMPGHVLYADPPAARRDPARDRDVAAEAYQHAAAQRTRQPGRAVIGGPGLHRSAQVEAESGRQPEPTRAGIQPHLLPPGRGGEEGDQRRSSLAWLACAAAVAILLACVGEGIADRRVQVAFGQPGGPQRRRDRVGQQRAHLHRVAGPAVKRG